MHLRTCPTGRTAADREGRRCPVILASQSLRSLLHSGLQWPAKCSHGAPVAYAPPIVDHPAFVTFPIDTSTIYRDRSGNNSETAIESTLGGLPGASLAPGGWLGAPAPHSLKTSLQPSVWYLSYA